MMTIMNTHISIIVSSINDFNSSIKRLRLTEWDRKQNPWSVVYKQHILVLKKVSGLE